MFRLSDPDAKSYGPLDLVERLLWLSNIKTIKSQIHRAIVKAGACAYLNNALSYTGDLDPQDRGLWRAKGLAVTCLGNLMEVMDEAQFREYVLKGMIDNVVAIKEDKRVPLVQKGQAIFTLQRYTHAAKRRGVHPYYEEAVSELISADRGVFLYSHDTGYSDAGLE